jgi:hypothetical protein
LGALTLNDAVEPIVVNVAQFDKVNNEFYTLVWTVKVLKSLILMLSLLISDLLRILSEPQVGIFCRPVDKKLLSLLTLPFC